MKGTVTVKLQQNRPRYGTGGRKFVNVEADYETDGEDYTILAVRCSEGLPDIIYDDDFYEAIDEDIAQDAGEHEAERLSDRYDTAL
jgi:hypothetical protein